MQIIIDEEFKSLLPALDSETYARLEENLLQHGCRDAVVLWNGTLIDGHNRYEICTKHGIPFNTVDKEFDSREEVLIWIISTQVARRNLSPMQLTHFRGLHYRAVKKLRGRYDRKDHIRHSDGYAEWTSQKLGDEYNVSSRTMERDAKVSEAIDSIGVISAEAKGKILSGEVSVDKKVLERLSSKQPEEILKMTSEIEDGTYVRSKQESPAQPEEGYTDIRKITDTFYSEIRKLTKSGDKAGRKTALRIYIDTLEELYRKI